MRVVGVGRDAEVWSATQVASPETVALKRPHRNDPVTVAHVLREARIGQYLHHPSVVATLGAGCDAAGWYVVLEYVDGPSLASLLAHHPASITAGFPARIPSGAALALVGDLCAGLQYLHTARDFQGQPLGVVHGDLSPANILLTSTGRAKIADFGDATFRGAPSDRHRGWGTPGFAAPEIRRHETFDHRADIFAAARIVRAMLAYTSHRVTPVLDAVLTRATAPAPSRRYPDAATFGAALSAAWPPIPANDPGLDLAIATRAPSIVTSSAPSPPRDRSDEVDAWHG